MFWGCIGYNLLGPLIEIKGNLNAEKYISNVLEMFYRKCMNRRKKNCLFMQDNAPCHKARLDN